MISRYCTAFERFAGIRLAVLIQKLDGRGLNQARQSVAHVGQTLDGLQVVIYDHRSGEAADFICVLH